EDRLARRPARPPDRRSGRASAVGSAARRLRPSKVARCRSTQSRGTCRSVSSQMQTNDNPRGYQAINAEEIPSRVLQPARKPSQRNEPGEKGKDHAKEARGEQAPSYMEAGLLVCGNQPRDFAGDGRGSNDDRQRKTELLGLRFHD